jgi:hypothetical protein
MRKLRASVYITQARGDHDTKQAKNRIPRGSFVSWQSEKDLYSSIGRLAGTEVNVRPFS